MSESSKPDGGHEDGKGTRHRSPNHPTISLKKAVERVEALNEKYKRSPVPVGVAQTLWGYKSDSSAGQQCIAALKAFGLIVTDGEGKAKKLRVSEPAFRIIMNSADRQALLQKAVLGPSIHQELWEKYQADGGIPADEIIRYYLLLDREKGKFNEDVVDAFIANFRSSLEYAGLLEGDKITASEELDPANRDRGSAQVTVDCGVQWTSQGADQFQEPRRVLGFSDDRKWAFVEGTNTGLPVDQLTVVVPKMKSDAQPTPPPSPFGAGQSSVNLPPPPKVGMTQEMLTLDEGSVVLQWPNNLSKDSVQELQDWIEVLVRRVQRKAGMIKYMDSKESLSRRKVLRDQEAAEESISTDD